MPDKSKHRSNPEQVDQMLKQAFLDLDFDDPENEAMLEALAVNVMAPVSMNTASSGSFTRFIKKIRFQLLGTLCLLVLVFAAVQVCTKKEKIPPAAKTAAQKRVTVTAVKKEEQVSHQTQATAIQGAILPILSAKPFNTIVQANPGKRLNMARAAIAVPVHEPAEPWIEERFPAEEISNKEIAYGLPQFTLEDVKINNRQKKKMIDQLLKPSKPNYLFIPDGKIEYNGSTKKLGDFYMQGHEVTNLEYRTFLFELLYQKRKDDYLKARPKEELWLNCTGNHRFDHFKNDYFNNKAYNDYPVVNITAEAAKMYCIWLDTMTQAWADDELDLYIDLPKESEWIYCAKGGQENSSYPWGTNSIQNNKNAFLANFGVQKDSAKLKYPFNYKVKINPRAYTSAGLVLNADTLATAGVLEYNPNPYGLYCMSGNAAEWVLSEDGQSARAIGGSWGSSAENLKINSENEFAGITCSPFIGFRVLVLMRKK